MKSLFDNKELLEYACSHFTSVASAMDYFGRSRIGGNYKTFYKYCDKYGLTPPKAPPNQTIKHTHLSNRTTDENIFVDSCPFKIGGQSLKKRLIGLGVEDRCVICGQLPEWNGLPLVLQLDHINGNNKDNRRENLRILCGHCHSQTDTFSGRNRKIKYNCLDCFRPIKKESTRCPSCRNKVFRTPEKIVWPSEEKLQELVFSMPITHVAKQLGVSDKAVIKRCKTRGVPYPSKNKAP